MAEAIDDVEPKRQAQRDSCARDFAALFAELGTANVAAPIGDGLLRLLDGIADVKVRRTKSRP